MKRNLKTMLLCIGLATSSALISCTPGERGAVTGGAIGAGTGALITGGAGGALVDCELLIWRSPSKSIKIGGRLTAEGIGGRP